MKRPTKHAHRCPTCGQRVGLSLTPEQVAEIKLNLSQGSRVATLAKTHGVTYQAIYRIKQGQTWKSVK